MIYSGCLGICEVYNCDLWDVGQGGAFIVEAECGERQWEGLCMRLNSLQSANLRYSDTSQRPVGLQRPNRRSFRKKALIPFIC